MRCFRRPVESSTAARSVGGTGEPNVLRRFPSSPPKIVFNRLNGRRHSCGVPKESQGAAEGFTAAHEENVRFVHEVWQEVEQKLEDRRESSDHHGPVQYTEKTPSAVMKNFVPIDLEEWWAQRFLANIANLS
uniref:MAPK regulated corepressor interacting protein 2 n=1 Tax=Oryzias sinensis TaxID=183150 RepID=A0A8C7X6B0_9TELE